MTDTELLASLEEIVERVVRREVRHILRTSAKADGWMTQAQAASHLGVSEKTINRLRQEGTIKAVLLGKRWRYSKEALDKATVKPWVRR